MSPSGAELLRQVKSQIEEIDPGVVHAQLAAAAPADPAVRALAAVSANGNGTAHAAAAAGVAADAPAGAPAAAPVLIDVRETEEFAAGHIPGAKHVPKSYLETRIEAAVPDRDAQIVLYCQSGNRSAWAARTLIDDLGYTNVASMTGGITLWKDRGYEVNVPRALSAEQRERYSRHLLMPEVGVEGQVKLLDAKVLLLGAGGLGSPTALYLAAAGVGTLGLVDDDEVDLSNLQRQVIHSTPKIGVPKVDSAEEAIRALNPDVKVQKFPVRLNAENIMGVLASASGLRPDATGAIQAPETGTASLTPAWDVIVDGVDNFPTRYLLNDATVRLQIPVVSASILGFDGQLSIFKPYDGPCYRCLFPQPPPAELAPSCGANGVLGVLPGTMGLLQATEVVKLILGIGDPAIGRLLLYDALAATLSEVKVRRDPECPICSRPPDSITAEEMGVFPDYEAFCAAAG